MPETTTASPRVGYWRHMPRELAYLLIKFPIALTGFVVTVVLFSVGVGTIPIVIGLFLLVGALYTARGFGATDVALVSWARGQPIRRPNWRDREAGTGFAGWFRAVIGNSRYWLALLHVMVVDFIITCITWGIALTWAVGSLSGLTHWFWAMFLPSDSSYPIIWIFERFGYIVGDPQFVESVVYFVFGIIFTLTLPLVTRGLVTVHWLVAKGILGAPRTEALEREVATLAESRGAAHSAEGHSLRRLERDIHDGPQQRLVRLQMDIAAAERQLEQDPDQARLLLATAKEQSREALEELRALSRGFAPPILLDRGLVAALESLAARNVVPTTVVDALPADAELPQEIERNAYFIATEALANATKHAQASAIEVRVARAEADGQWLEVSVHDDGVGGAHPVHGHGLAGLEERTRGLGGTLELSSPDGGPTTVISRLPLLDASGR